MTPPRRPPQNTRQKGGTPGAQQPRTGTPATGTIVRLLVGQGHGYIRLPDRRDIYFHRGDLVGPRRSNQKTGLMKDRVDRLAQGTKSRAPPARLGRRRCDSDVSAAPAQATSEAAE